LKREHFHRFSYLSSIRIAINIDEDTLEKAMIVTGETKKGPPTTKAATEYIRRKMVRKFANMVREGQFAR
jgi:hypothetical protein